MTYPIHPIAKIYPPLAAHEFDKLKEHIKANGLFSTIVLYEEQVLDGAHRQRACEETGVEPRYDRPTIKDPIAYVIGCNERRRHLTTDQLAVVAEKMEHLKWGTNRFEKKIEGPVGTSTLNRTQIAKLLGTSKTTIKRVRYARKRGIPELLPAIENGNVTAYQAEEIAHLPKEQQLSAIEGIATKPNLAGRPKKVRPGLSPDEAAKDAECLEYINRPSIFPTEAPIPKSDNAARLREAIEWLRDHEPRIQSLSQRECYDLLLCTNAIASYNMDRELDQRIMDWQQTLWRKRLRQEERIALQRKLRHRTPSKVSPIKRKMRLPFEDRFENFWSVIEVNLKSFKSSEQKLVVAEFRKRLSGFFSEISAERNGSGHVVDNSDGETEVTANNIETKING